MPQLRLNVPRDVLVRLQALAQSQRRTPAAQAEWLLLDALEAWATDQDGTGTLGAGHGSAYPARLDASAENDLPGAVQALQKAIHD